LINRMFRFKSAQGQDCCVPLFSVIGLGEAWPEHLKSPPGMACTITVETPQNTRVWETGETLEVLEARYNLAMREGSEEEERAEAAPWERAEHIARLKKFLAEAGDPKDIGSAPEA
jgi:hypothetical protein